MGAVPKQHDFGAAPSYRLLSATRPQTKGWSNIRPVADSDSQSDDDLMRALARGEADAGPLLLDRHLAHVLAVARRMLGDDSEAEDVAQETFMRAWKAASRWEPGRAKVSTWLHRIAMNLCLDRLRKKKPEPMEDGLDAASGDPDPEMQLQQRQMASRIDGAIQALPERQRAAIVLSHYQNLSNPDAADILEISVEALESLLARGRRSLRDALKPDWNELTGRGDAPETGYKAGRTEK